MEINGPFSKVVPGPDSLTPLHQSNMPKPFQDITNRP